LASPGRLISLDDAAATAPELVGAKAATLALARRDGLPALPGYVVPAAEGAPALRAGCDALRAAGRKTARRAVFSVPVRPELISELGWAVGQLGGRAIVRSSSVLESDPRWSGAFSSIREIGADDVAAAARSCWASAFAPDPLDRLEQCGLDPARLGLSLLVQPDLTPDFGGLARIRGSRTDVSWTSGHPGALLAGVTEGQSVQVTGPGPGSDCHEVRPEAAGAIGPAIIAAVARLAHAVHATSGHEVIEWAWAGGRIHLLQSGPGPAETPGDGNGQQDLEPAAGISYGLVRLTGTACVAGDAVGPLRFAAPGQAAAGPDPYILVSTQPFAALAPLLFGARGVVCQTGPADCHLASVAGALGVPMLVGVRLREAVGPLAALGDDGGWFGAISGQRAELTLIRAESSAPADQDRVRRDLLESVLAPAGRGSAAVTGRRSAPSADQDHARR
jgi:phosphoenolpyruvate synthase/pyruvate phosphate dikinase